MNEEDKRKVKIGIAIAGFTVVLLVLLQNLGAVADTARFLLRILSPFLFGVCIAFVLNIPMRFFEQTVFKRLNRKKNPRWEKARRPVCVIIVMLLFFGLLTALFAVIIPQLVQSVTRLGENFSGYVESFEGWANDFLGNFGLSADFMETIADVFEKFSGQIAGFVTDSLPKVMNTAGSITSGIINLLVGFVVSVYMLISKEKLMRNVKAVIYAFLPARTADGIAHVYHVTNQRFNGFVSGQLTEAFILGTLCYVGMSLFGMEYALLISIIVGITNVVPIVGPIIGTIPGALILLIVNPMKMVWFVVFIIVLQQIEANFIYPKVVGDSIGLPGMWVLFAVMVGGSLFGLAGVLLGVPIFAVLYTLLAETVGRRLKKKNLKV